MPVLVGGIHCFVAGWNLPRGLPVGWPACWHLLVLGRGLQRATVALLRGLGMYFALEAFFRKILF